MKKIFVPLLALTALTVSSLRPVSIVHSATSEEIQRLNDQVSEQRGVLEQVNGRIAEYERRIAEKQAQAVTLRNETEILENRVAKTELEIEALEATLQSLLAELQLLEGDITTTEERLRIQREYLRTLLQEMYVQGRRSSFEVMFGNVSFSELFDQVTSVERVQSSLTDVLQETQAVKQRLEETRDRKQETKTAVEASERQLEGERERLAREQAAKESLLAQTKASQAEFAALVRDLRAEQQDINREIARLQDTIARRLQNDDRAGDLTTISWPLTPSRGISATFHDPTYPFRHLFEHSGIDLPTSVGTPVRSAAPGYVAFARESRSYGYYIMVIHTDGIATLYAHLSRMDVRANQFVNRGDVIGLSGGRAGARGSGLSTGPHLHFEVRKNGIPVNPSTYLPN